MCLLVQLYVETAPDESNCKYHSRDTTANDGNRGLVCCHVVVLGVLGRDDGRRDRRDETKDVESTYTLGTVALPSICYDIPLRAGRIVIGVHLREARVPANILARPTTLPAKLRW